MASYTVIGHPLDYYAIGVDVGDVEPLRVLLQANGVGATVSITLSGNSDTQAKAQGVLQ